MVCLHHLLTGLQIYQMKALALFSQTKDLMFGLETFVEIPTVDNMSISQLIQMLSGISRKRDAYLKTCSAP